MALKLPRGTRAGKVACTPPAALKIGHIFVQSENRLSFWLLPVGHLPDVYDAARVSPNDVAGTVVIDIAKALGRPSVRRIHGAPRDEGSYFKLAVPLVQTGTTSAIGGQVLASTVGRV